MARAIFLDRDGTIIIHRPYLHRPAEVALLPGAAEALSRARKGGWKIFLVTNQSGVGRGLFGMADVEAVNHRMIELLALGADVFTGICIAPEAPDQPSLYRKPSPRYILETIKSCALVPGACWMIGDTASDWEAGLSAGIRACAVRSDLTSDESELKRRNLQVPLFENLNLAFAHAEAICDS